MPSFLLTGVGRKRYHEIKDEWFGNAEVFERQDVVEVIPASFDLVLRPAELLFLQERHRIDVDCRRTDRTQALFASQTPSETTLDREKQQYQRYSTISPTPLEVGAQSPSNEHIDRLGSILLTYNFYEKDLGAPSLRLDFLKRESALTCRVRRVRAGYVRPLRALVCCRWLGRASDILVFRGSDESDGPLGLFVIFPREIDSAYTLLCRNKIFSETRVG
jgi:hypothetical protein